MVDISKLATGSDNLDDESVSKDRQAWINQHATLTKAIQNGLRDLEMPEFLKNFDTGLSKSFKDLEIPDHLKQDWSGLSGVLNDIDSTAIHDRMKGLAGGLDQESSLARVARGIDRQQSAIDALRESPPVSIPSVVHHPAKETNERLERIEKRFDMAFDLAKDSAQVANGLQASAAEFLHKFQVEADKNNESVNQTISVARWSLVVVVVVACVQIAAPYFVPDFEAQALRGTVADLRDEVEALRDSHKETSERLIEALATVDADTPTAPLTTQSGPR